MANQVYEDEVFHLFRKSADGTVSFYGNQSASGLIGLGQPRSIEPLVNGAGLTKATHVAWYPGGWGIGIQLPA
ncbi:MAG: hypothetical protein ACXIU5_05680 [Halomonadaceae bacterium]|jgi:hypothetical protein